MKGVPVSNKKECGCRDRCKKNESCYEIPLRLHHVKKKEFKSIYLKYLKEHNGFGQYSNYVCSHCIRYASEMLKPDERVDISGNGGYSEDEDRDEICEIEREGTEESIGEFRNIIFHH